ncbi:hypothetical protein LYZ77_22190, partial [Xanthomonas hortorum pv. vitians]
RYARFGFAQEANDLFLGKALLHVQSPRGRELDSKLGRYSKLGGRRCGLGELLFFIKIPADPRSCDTPPGSA